MTKKLLHLISASFLGGLVLSACSLKKDADTMRDSTQNIEKNSKQLTYDNNKLSNNMLEVECSKGRTEAMADFEAAKSDSDRFVAASKFLVFMEYQKWMSNSSDTINTRYEYFRRAVDIFFASTMKWINQDKPINCFDDLFYFLNDLTDPTFRNAGAMAAQLDFIHPDQRATAEIQGVPVVSMYDLIVKGLEYKAASERGEEIPAYAKVVLDWEPHAIHFLQLRHNFLVAKAMGKLTAFSDNYTNKVLMSMYMTSWLVQSKVNMSSVSAETYKELNTLLASAEQTKEDLLKLGHKPVYNSLIMSSWKKLDFRYSQRKYQQSLQDEFIKRRTQSLVGY